MRCLLVARRPVYVQYVQFTYLQSKFAEWHFIFCLRPYASSLFCENCFGCESIFDCIFGFKLFASSKVFVLKISPRPGYPVFRADKNSAKEWRPEKLTISRLNFLTLTPLKYWGHWISIVYYSIGFYRVSYGVL